MVFRTRDINERLYGVNIAPATAYSGELRRKMHAIAVGHGPITRVDVHKRWFIGASCVLVFEGVNPSFIIAFVNGSIGRWEEEGSEAVD